MGNVLSFILHPSYAQPASLAGPQQQIDVGIDDRVLGPAVAHLEIAGDGFPAIDQVMAVLGAGRDLSGHVGLGMPFSTW